MTPKSATPVFYFCNVEYLVYRLFLYLRIGSKAFSHIPFYGMDTAQRDILYSVHVIQQCDTFPNNFHVNV